MGLDEGKVIINNKDIYKGMDSGSFIRLFSSEINSYLNRDIERYNFKSPQIIDGVLLWIRIVFKKNSISSIELRDADPKLKNSYDICSDDRVELKRKSHDKWLINQLGHPHERKPSSIKYNYTWGEALSYYDPKDGDIGIAINYYKDNV